MSRSLPIFDARLGADPEPDPSVAREKLNALRADLASRLEEGVLVAFSGGMDSAFLLWAAHSVQAESGGKLVALTTTSPSTPRADKNDAFEFAGWLGVSLVWRESREMDLTEYTCNDRDRCYHCKNELFRVAEEVARAEELRWLLYGYNASDHSDDRPGHRAAQEHEVRSPLSDAGLTKAEIRLLMREAEVPLADKPSSPCLSSRLMTGVEVTPDRLRDVEALEDVLREAGLGVFRVRVCADGTGGHFVRVEVAPEEMGAVLACREALQETGAARGYRWVTLDLGGYRTGGGVA